MNLVTHLLLLFSIFLLASALPTETSRASLANMSDIMSTWDFSIPDSSAISPDFDPSTTLFDTDTLNLTKRCGNCYPNRRLSCAKLWDGHIVILRCMVDCWNIM